MAVNYAYEWVGKGIEDMADTTSMEVTSVKDVRGETEVKLTRGEETTSVTPLVVNVDTKLALFINNAKFFGWELSDLDQRFIKVWTGMKYGVDYDTGEYMAIDQIAGVEPGDFATGNGALECSCTLHYKGARVIGTYDPTAVGEKFTPITGDILPSMVHYKNGDLTRSDFRLFYAYDPTQFPPAPAPAPAPAP